MFNIKHELISSKNKLKNLEIKFIIHIFVAEIKSTMLKIELYNALYIRTLKELRENMRSYWHVDQTEIPTLWPVSNHRLWSEVIRPYLISDLTEFALIYYPHWKEYHVRQMVVDAINTHKIYRFMREKLKFTDTNQAKKAWNVFIRHHNVTEF